MKYYYYTPLPTAAVTGEETEVRRSKELAKAKMVGLGLEASLGLSDSSLCHTPGYQQGIRVSAGLAGPHPSLATWATGWS